MQSLDKSEMQSLAEGEVNRLCQIGSQLCIGPTPGASSVPLESQWDVIQLQNRPYLIKYKWIEEGGYDLMITDTVRLWRDRLSPEDALKRYRDLNSDIREMKPSPDFFQAVLGEISKGRAKVHIDGSGAVIEVEFDFYPGVGISFYWTMLCSPQSPDVFHMEFVQPMLQLLYMATRNQLVVNKAGDLEKIKKTSDELLGLAQDLSKPGPTIFSAVPYIDTLLDLKASAFHQVELNRARQREREAERAALELQKEKRKRKRMEEIAEAKRQEEAKVGRQQRIQELKARQDELIRASELAYTFETVEELNAIEDELKSLNTPEQTQKKKKKKKKKPRL